jgi:hypothetical protein
MGQHLNDTIRLHVADCGADSGRSVDRFGPSKVGREAGGQPDPISRGSGTKGPSQRQKASRLLSFDCAAAHFVMNNVDGCSSGSGRDI